MESSSCYIFFFYKWRNFILINVLIMLKFQNNLNIKRINENINLLNK